MKSINEIFKLRHMLCHEMPNHFKNIWKKDERTGNYYLPNLKSFLLEQEKEFPSMDLLYKHQMDLIKKDFPTVFS